MNSRSSRLAIITSPMPNLHSVTTRIRHFHVAPCTFRFSLPIASAHHNYCTFCRNNTKGASTKMKRQREDSKWPPVDELVELICETVGEYKNRINTITVLHRCPHPFCTSQSTNNIIKSMKHSCRATFSHLQKCIGRHDNVEGLLKLYDEIKKNPQDRTEILNRFRADTIARMKPNSGDIVEHTQKRTRIQLPAVESQDINSSLEHICMIGAKNRHDDKRRKLFETTHKELLEKEHGLPLDAPPVNPFGPPTHPDNNLFAEDIRVYGQHETIPFRDLPESASPMEAWPRREKAKSRSSAKGQKYDDSSWNAEHGDAINIVAFTKARLSQKIPTPADQELMNGSNLLVATTDAGLYETQVPQALLQRCWERAVHASSCFTSMSKVGVEAPETTDASSSTSPTPKNTQQSLYNTVQERASRSKKDSVEKMKAVGLGNYFKNAVRLYQLKCPVCSRQFEHRVELERCFFGGLEASAPSETGFRGCCWSLIKEKQYSMIESALVAHVNTQVAGILDIILKAAEQKVPNQVGQEKMRLFNWYDVLKFVEESFASSQRFPDRSREQGVTSALETLEFKPGSSPIFLNPDVLEAVRNRLIDRYADVPY